MIEVHEVRQELVIEAVYGPVPDACPKCGVDGKKETDFRDSPVRGKPVIIRCDRQRYRPVQWLEHQMAPAFNRARRAMGLPIPSKRKRRELPYV